MSGHQHASPQLEGLDLSAHMAVGVSCGGSWLVSCTYAAAEAWASCQCGFWALVEKGRLMSVSMITCRVKNGEICRQSPAAVLAVSFCSGEILCFSAK